MVTNIPDMPSLSRKGEKDSGNSTRNTETEKGGGGGGGGEGGGLCPVSVYSGWPKITDAETTGTTRQRRQILTVSRLVQGAQHVSVRGMLVNL